MAIFLDDVSSDTVNLFVENYPARVIPRRRYSVEQIAGKNGDLFFDEGTFENYTQSYNVYVSGEKAGTNLNAALNKVTGWLYPAMTQYVKLRDDYDTSVYRRAYFSGGGDISNYFDKQGRGTLEFICQPQRFSIAGGNATTYTGVVNTSLAIPLNFPGGFTMPATPYLNITAVADVDMRVSLELYKYSQGTGTTTIVSSFLIPKSVVANNSLIRIIIDNENQQIYGQDLSGQNISISEDIQLTGEFFKVTEANMSIRISTTDDMTGKRFSASVTPNWWSL